MSKTIDKAQYVRRIATEDIALIMAELHSIIICDPKRGKHVDGDAVGALETLGELSVAIRVWADAQKKLEASDRIEDRLQSVATDSVTPQMKAAALKSIMPLA